MYLAKYPKEDEMENTKESSFSDQIGLEQWIETYGLSDLLKTIRDICMSKADYMKANDNAYYGLWFTASKLIERTNQDVDNLFDNFDFETKRREPDWGPDRDNEVPTPLTDIYWNSIKGYTNE